MVLRFWPRASDYTIYQMPMPASLQLSQIKRQLTRHITVALLMLLVAGAVQANGVTGRKPAPGFSGVDPIALYGESALYYVYRNDKKVGEHTVTFKRTGDSLSVVVNSSLTVTYLGIPVYRYSYESTEQWENDTLVSVESTIVDNRKKPRVIEAVAGSRVLTITDAGQSRSAALVNYPSNHWHKSVLDESRLYHTVHGKVYAIKIEALGFERVALPSADESSHAIVQAQRYRYERGFRADVWYDTSKRWFRLTFTADDGSEIDYRCVSCVE